MYHSLRQNSGIGLSLNTIDDLNKKSRSTSPSFTCNCKKLQEDYIVRRAYH